MKVKISEKVLRRIWKEQKFINTPLTTLDGKKIEVISPGKSNPDSGPDFLNAKIYIGGNLYLGDVEIHMNTTDWKAHQHENDPKYNRVILHVVFSQQQGSNTTTFTKSQRSVPVLFLKNFINDFIIENIYEDIYKEPLSEITHLNCHQKNKNISENLLREWLIKLSVERLEYKLRRMNERLKELVHYEKLKEPTIKYNGEIYEFKIEDLPNFEPELSAKDFSNIKLWDQLFYESLFEALGYTKNQLPFLKLAKFVNLNFLRKLNYPENEFEKILAIESILLAHSGLIPELARIKEKETQHYINSVFNNLKMLNIKIKNPLIQPVEWRFFRLRPENFPTLRISGAANLAYKILFQGLFKNILNILTDGTLNPQTKIHNITELFRVNTNNFWRHHYRFDKRTSKEIKVLIGGQKITEILMNVVIPIILLYARIFKRRELRENTLRIYEQIKVKTSNLIIKKLDAELIRKKLKVNGAIFYQGLIQLYKFYCIEEKCAECAIDKALIDYKK